SAEFDCAFSPARVVLRGNSQVVQIAISRKRSPNLAGVPAQVFLLPLLGMAFVHRKKRTRLRFCFFSTAVLAVVLNSGCALPSPQTSQLRVNATSQQASHSTTITVTTNNQ